MSINLLFYTLNGVLVKGDASVSKGPQKEVPLHCVEKGLQTNKTTNTYDNQSPEKNIYKQRWFQSSFAYLNISMICRKVFHICHEALGEVRWGVNFLNPLHNDHLI